VADTRPFYSWIGASIVDDERDVRVSGDVGHLHALETARVHPERRILQRNAGQETLLRVQGLGTAHPITTDIMGMNYISSRMAELMDTEQPLAMHLPTCGSE
jgi:hypothetical protein